MFLSRVLTFFQILPTMFKPEKSKFPQNNGAFHFCHCNFQRESENEEGSQRIRLNITRTKLQNITSSVNICARVTSMKTAPMSPCCLHLFFCFDLDIYVVNLMKKKLDVRELSKPKWKYIHSASVLKSKIVINCLLNYVQRPQMTHKYLLVFITMIKQRAFKNTSAATGF